jgi:hypothetical protein
MTTYSAPRSRRYLSRTEVVPENVVGASLGADPTADSATTLQHAARINPVFRLGSAPGCRPTVEHPPKVMIHRPEGQAGPRCARSRGGTAYDNAAAESVFATVKRELVHRRRFPTRASARTAIFEFIEVFYNRRRIHSSIGYLSPEGFERRLRQERKDVTVA